MRTPTLLSFLAVACLFSACETPRQTYVKQHPEISPEHRRIILAGKIKFGDPVAGMTRDQVRVVMGKDPDQFDKINGEDAWIWVRSKTIGLAGGESTTPADNGGPAREGGGGRKQEGNYGGGGGGRGLDDGKQIKTTVFFTGNLATHVTVADGSL